MKRINDRKKPKKLTPTPYSRQPRNPYIHRSRDVYIRHSGMSVITATICVIRAALTFVIPAIHTFVIRAALTFVIRAIIIFVIPRLLSPSFIDYYFRHYATSISVIPAKAGIQGFSFPPEPSRTPFCANACQRRTS
ncbi:MAG: hypothetical protein ABFD12_02260, partial [Syntrophorhabdus sp.]